MIERAVWYQTEHHGVLNANVAAEGSGQADTIQRRHSHLIHQQFNAGVERGFC